MYLLLSQPGETYAKAMSALLWRLSRPEAVRNPADVSRYWCGWVIHPQTGAAALAMPEDEPMFVHPTADAAGFVATIAHLINEVEKAETEAAIRGNRGKHAEPPDFLPGSIRANLRTRAQMEAAGWFQGGAP